MWRGVRPIAKRWGFAYAREVEWVLVSVSVNGCPRVIRWSSEGSVGQRDISICQDSEMLLEKVRDILLEFKIKPNPIHFYVKRNKKRYYFRITGYYNLVNFLTNIGFTATKKSELLEKYIFHIKNNKSFKLRRNETKSTILYLLHNNGCLSKKEITILLKQLYPDLKWHRTTISCHLHDLKNKNLIEMQEEGYKLKSSVTFSDSLLGA